MIKFLNNARIALEKVYSKDYIKTMSAFLLFFFGFSLIYFSLDKFPGMDDPFFHIRFAEMIRERGFSVFADFDWLYFSKIAQDQTYFIYYNFLFYIIMIPFTLVEPLFLGIKLYGVVFASLSFSGLYYFLLKIKEKNAFFLTIMLFALFNYGAITRILVARPFTLAPVLLLMLLYFAYEKKYLGVFIMSIIYFFWHTATFFFPLIVVGIYFAFENFYGKKLDWRLFLYASAGIALSFCVTLFFAPGLFIYMKEIIFGVLYDTIIGKEINLAEGGEVYGINALDFFKQNTIIIALLAVSFTFEIFNYIEKKRSDGELVELSDSRTVLRSSLFFLSLIFLLGTFLSKRNGDFLLFFSAAYVAMVLNLFIESIRFESHLIRRSIFTGLIVVSVFLFSGNFLFIHDLIAVGGNYNAIEAPAEWLKSNTEEGDVVFNPTWNWFTLLFYYNSHNNYITGIEPRFFYDYDPYLYWTWWNISTQGYLCPQEKCEVMNQKKVAAYKDGDSKKKWFEEEGNKVADHIVHNFKAHYIITSNEFKNLNDLMEGNDRFEKVFTDTVYNTYFIYKIK